MIDVQYCMNTYKQNHTQVVMTFKEGQALLKTVLKVSLSKKLVGRVGSLHLKHGNSTISMKSYSTVTRIKYLLTIWNSLREIKLNLSNAFPKIFWEQLLIKSVKSFPVTI